MIEQQRTQGISRRTVATAAAWSVPVISVAASAPAYASSQEIKYAVQGDGFPRGPFQVGSDPNSDQTSWGLYVENLGATTIPANTITLTILKKPDFFITYTTFDDVHWSRDLNAAGDEVARYLQDLPPRINPAGGENDPYTSQLVIVFAKEPIDKATPSSARADFTVTGAAPQFLDLEIPY